MLDSSIIGRLPGPLGDMPAVAHDDRLLILGGASGMENRSEVLAVTATGAVEGVGRLPQELRGHQAIRLGDHAFVLGGFTGETISTAFRLNLKTFESDPIAAMPQDAAWFAATEWNGRIYVLGGFSVGGGYWSEIAVYDPQGDSWDRVSGAFPTTVFPKASLGSNSVLSAQDRIFSFGGADTFDRAAMRANALDVVASYDPVGKCWSRLESVIEAREGLVAVAHDGHAYLVGGMPDDSDKSSPTIDRINLETGEAVIIARMQKGRTAPACGILDNTLIVAGGVTTGVAEMTDTIEAVVL